MCHTRVVETENRYFEEGMEFVSFFMFVVWNALLTNLTFGKGESQTANHFLSFDSLMSTTLFTYLLYFLLLIQKHFTTISIDYCKSKTKKNNFLKNYRVFNKNVLSAFIQKIGYWMQNEQKLRQTQITCR